MSASKPIKVSLVSFEIENFINADALAIMRWSSSIQPAAETGSENVQVFSMPFFQLNIL
jgi:hypothetical protein